MRWLSSGSVAPRTQCPKSPTNKNTQEETDFMEGLPLRGQVALVTGGSRGIGRAICETLWKHGASVAVNYSKSAAQAETIVNELRETRSPLAPDQQALAIGFDVASEDAVEAGVRAVLGQLQNIDILVNNAGIAVDGLLVRTK